MFHRNVIPDKTILNDINKRLVKTGMGGRSHIVATVRSGQVTLTGELQYETQRRPVMHAVNRVDGIKGVVDRMTASPQKRC